MLVNSVAHLLLFMPALLCVVVLPLVSLPLALHSCIWKGREVVRIWVSLASDSKEHCWRTYDKVVNALEGYLGNRESGMSTSDRWLVTHEKQIESCVYAQMNKSINSCYTAVKFMRLNLSIQSKMFQDLSAFWACFTLYLYSQSMLLLFICFIDFFKKHCMLINISHNLIFIVIF